MILYTVVHPKKGKVLVAAAKYTSAFKKVFSTPNGWHWEEVPYETKEYVKDSNNRKYYFDLIDNG